jgi:hypothetical protein
LTTLLRISRVTFLAVFRDRYVISLIVYPVLHTVLPDTLVTTSSNKHKTKFPFPHATVTPILGRPDPLSLGILQGKLYANAISVPTELGGGIYGHLALVMPAAEYVTMGGAVAYGTLRRSGSVIHSHC